MLAFCLITNLMATRCSPLYSTPTQTQKHKSKHIAHTTPPNTLINYTKTTLTDSSVHKIFASNYAGLGFNVGGRLRFVNNYKCHVCVCRNLRRNLESIALVADRTTPVNMDIAVNGICESICISGPHGTVIKTLRLIKFYFYRNLMAGIEGNTKRRLESGRCKALLASWSSFYLHFELLVKVGTGF